MERKTKLFVTQKNYKEARKLLGLIDYMIIGSEQCIERAEVTE